MKAKKDGFIKDILRNCRARLFWISVLTVLQSVAQVAMAFLTRFVIDSAIEKDGKLLLWGILLGADILIQLAVYLLVNWYTSSTTDRLIATFRSRLLRSAVYSADARFQEFHSGALLSRGIEDVNIICDGVVYALPVLLGQSAKLAAAFCAVLLIRPEAAVALAIGGAGMLVYVSVIRPVLKRKHRSVREAEETVMATMQEDLQKLELIQSLQTQEQTVKKFDRRLHIARRRKFGRRVWSVGANGIINGAVLLGSGILLLWGADCVARDLLTYGMLASLLQLLGQFRGPLMGLSGLWARITSVEVAGERLSALLEIPEQPEPVAIEKAEAVVFENVTFSYPGDEQAVVENFSLRLPLDGWVSLSGISGRGKTTLFKLILGLYAPQQGRVYLETEQGKIDCSAATRQLFAYVPQDYALFSGTVAENLLLVRPDATEQERRDALDAACASFVFELSEGENARVGENNTGLSKGQLQRLAIARAILMQRKVLLLDECTSALDAETEQGVLNNLRKLAPGALLVTHRPEALESIPGVTSVLMEK